MDLDFIPLTVTQRTRPEERHAMRMAVLQVLTDLLIERVPEREKAALFGRAYDLMQQAGWGLDELAEATEPGPRRDHLFEILEI